MKLKILYIISSLTPCGPDNVMADIIRNLDFNRFDVSVLALSKASNGNLKEELESIGVKCYLLGLTRFEYFFLGRKKMRYIINMLSPDIIHTHCIRSTILIGFIGKIKSIKCVTIHNYPHLDYVYGYGKIIGSISGWLMLQAIKKFDVKISCSKAIANELKDKFTIDTISVQNGVKENRFIKDDKFSIRRRLGLPVDKNIIISVGSISKRKNTLFLVNALQHLKREDVFVIFLGDGEQLAACKANGTEQMLFLGYKSNVVEYLVASDIYISASRAEGLPLSVLEALNAGLPVVLSDIAPHREVLMCAGNNTVGHIYKQSSKNDFLEKLSLTLTDKNIRAYSQNSLLLGQKVFSDKVMGKRYEYIYLETAGLQKESM